MFFLVRNFGSGLLCTPKFKKPKTFKNLKAPKPKKPKNLKTFQKHGFIPAVPQTKPTI